MKDRLFTALFCVAMGVTAGYWISEARTKTPQRPADTLATIDHEDEAFAPAQIPIEQGNNLCQLSAAALANIRQVVRTEMENLPARTLVARPEPTAASPEPPSREQQELYAAVEQRIYTHANSGRPLTESLAQDPDFQKLTPTQKLRIGQEIAARFNRGEISPRQLSGN